METEVRAPRRPSGGAACASLGWLVVLFVSLRDLQWRRRRFLIGVLAAGLVFALTLLMSGVSASFGNEIKNTVVAFNVDEWVVPSGVSGPFTSSRVFPASEA